MDLTVILERLEKALERARFSPLFKIVYSNRWQSQDASRARGCRAVSLDKIAREMYADDSSPLSNNI